MQAVQPSDRLERLRELSALLPVQHCLGRKRYALHQNIGPHGHAEGLRHGTGHFQALIETSLSQPADIERHGNHHGRQRSGLIVQGAYSGKERSQKIKRRKAAAEDRLTVNFTGTIDGVEFAGGKAEGFVFVLGQGRMLPEFEEAATGMAAGEKKTFTLTFPENYGNKELAGKVAQFDLECTKVEAPHYPAVDDEFAKSLAVESVDVLKAEIRTNIEREVQERLYERNRTEAFNAAVEACDFQAPSAIVHAEQERLAANFQQMMMSYGSKAQKAPLELFAEPAKKQARIGMMVTAIIDQNKIEATDDDVKARASMLAAAYEQPEEVVEDLVKNQRNNLAGRVLEEKALEFLFSKAKTTEETVTFDQLSGMGRE